MKTFDDLKQVLEDYNAWGSTNRSALSDFGTHRVDNDDQVFRINVFLENYFQRPILDSVGAFNALRAKLNIVGLDFHFDPAAVRTEGKFEFPVTRYGGEFGTTPETDLSKGFYRSEGPGDTLVKLTGEVVLEDSGYSVAAKLVQTEKTPGEASGGPV